ncbi:MAG: glutamine--scyllo-inositol aminotransferase [Chloroflexi bacterium]|nr:glutamine--scyllo-inositol aminotransferase [Chloroflexota bacterium]|tara:strand:- start:23102 stop:24190 length:1089 start_codon:yes stop_codon:yes gene_type:complete
MKNKIKLFDPVIGVEEENAILKVLKSKFWASGAGSGNVEKFENAFKKFIQSKTCVAVNSGTAALNLALSLFDIKNKEVILPSMSFVSTAHSIVENGGKPIFVDIEPNTLCIDPEKIRNAISKNTAAIIPVHFGGMPCNIEKIQKIGRSFNLDVIEDAAHAAGTRWKNFEKIGMHGSAVCFSFHPVKNLAMPTGGLISLNHKNHKKFKKLLFSRRWCGITNRKEIDYDVKEIGNNYYMNEFSAAIGLTQLKKLDRLNKIRRNIAKKYSQEIKLESKIPFDENCSYHLYWILVKNRKKFREKLFEKGIETGTHYKPIHLMKMYKNTTKLPVTELVGKQIVTIPIHPNLKKYEIKKIIDVVNKSL